MIRIPLLAVLLAASGAVAQPVNRDIESTFGPGDPARKGPSVEYRSVLDAPARNDEETPWRRANEDMGRLGGHAGQLRAGEAREPAREPRAPTAAVPPPNHRQH
jgi:hypothetical protein